MAEWLAKLDEILKLNGMATLTDAGRISARASDELAHAEYERFEIRRLEKRHSALEAEPDLPSELNSASKSIQERRKKTK